MFANTYKNGGAIQGVTQQDIKVIWTEKMRMQIKEMVTQLKEGRCAQASPI